MQFYRFSDFIGKQRNIGSKVLYSFYETKYNFLEWFSLEQNDTKWYPADMPAHYYRY